jgi:hypothetical protein
MQPKFCLINRTVTQVRKGRVLLLLFIIIILSGVTLSRIGTGATTSLLYQPQMIGDGDCGAIGGMKIGRENRSTR